MRHEFLTICLFGFSGLTCNCSAVHRHESDTVQPIEIALDRTSRDLIGYNRQRNTAFQTRLKLYGKRTNRQQRIYDFGFKMDAKILWMTYLNFMWEIYSKSNIQIVRSRNFHREFERKITQRIPSIKVSYFIFFEMT